MPGHEGGIDTPDRVFKKRFYMRKKDRNAGDIPDILQHGLGLRRLQLRVAQRVLREAVMLDMEITEPFRRQQDHNATHLRHRLVEPEASERRAMDALMQRRKEKGNQDPLRQQEKRPSRPLHRDQRADQPDQPDMPGKLHQPLHIRPLGQHLPLPARQGFYKLTTFHGMSLRENFPIGNAAFCFKNF